MKNKLIWLALSVALTLANRSATVQAQEATGTQATQTEATGTEAKPLLHPLFSDNAVLQRDRTVPVWGWTVPGTTVAVQFDAQKQTTRAATDGRWTISLPPHAAGGPHSLSVSGVGGASATRRNLLFGDVWLCGGQSNMAYDLYGALNPEAEIAAANYPDIRLLQVPNAITSAPIQSFEGAGWQPCSPQTVARFSGVGYFFGRELYKKLKVPIGLINSSWSGTPGEAWVSGPALATMPEFKPAVEALKQSENAPNSYARQMTAWWQNNDPGSRAHQEAPAFDDSNWKTIDEPGPWEDKGFADFDGVMWFRRTIDVPAAWAGRDLHVDLGSVDDNDTTFWNGTVVGATQGWNKSRNYTVPGAQVKAGRNTIAVRVLDTGGGGGLAGPALSMKSANDTVSLGGAWKIHQGPALQSLAPMPQSAENPNAPEVLFNGKIAPLLPGQIKGVIWYQGESNSDNQAEARQYRALLPLLVGDWRAHFGAQTPFYIVQLANFKALDDAPGNNPWPNTREAQLQTSQRLPNTPLVVTIDLGEEKNVHYPNKQEVGSRLARSALANTYGLKIESSGPTLREAKAINGAMQLSFDHAQGLNLKGEANRVFAVAGTDGKFAWATPQIAGNVVTLRSPDVPAPLYARFGWADNPRAVLYNAAALPASPFRTDEQPN
jgi:sialate O-acetylesterase